MLLEELEIVKSPKTAAVYAFQAIIHDKIMQCSSGAINTLERGQPSVSRSTMNHFDTAQFYLGRLCKRGHSYEQTGKSLRRISTRCCVECKHAYQAAYYQSNRIILLEQKKSHYQVNADTLRRRSRQYRQANLETVLEKVRKYYWDNRERLQRRNREYYQANRERLISINLRYRQENAEFCRRISLDYQKRNPQVARQRRQRYYARKAECIHQAFNIKQLQEHIAQWGAECAYCGEAAERMTLDHVIPIAKQGAHALYNLVPACQRCNSSKQEFDALDWYRRQPFYSPERWGKLQAILLVKEVMKDSP